MWWWLLPKNCTPFYNKYTRWRAVAVPSCPVAALLLLPARCPFQGHTDRWGKVSLPNQARRRWHKFSVASNRKTNLILETRTLLTLSLSLGDWIEGKEGDSNLVVSQIFLVFVTWSHRDPDADTRVVPRRWHRFFGKEGSLWGWGHTFDVVLVFLFSLMQHLTITTTSGVAVILRLLDSSLDSSTLRRCCSEWHFEYRYFTVTSLP